LKDTLDVAFKIPFVFDFMRKTKQAEVTRNVRTVDKANTSTVPTKGVTWRRSSARLYNEMKQQQLSKIRHELLHKTLPDCYCTVLTANSIKNFKYVYIEQQ
jgi:uncharacterized protein YqeY